MIVLKVASPATQIDLGVILANPQYDTQQVTNQEVKVLCFPSGGGIKVILPPTDFIVTQNLLVTVADASGDAGSNNITVEAGNTIASLPVIVHEKINGANTLVVSAAYGSAQLEILTTGAWIGGVNP